MRFIGSFSPKPWNTRRKALYKKQRETRLQAFAVAAQLRLLKSEEQRADSHWLQLKKEAPRTR